MPTRRALSGALAALLSLAGRTVAASAGTGLEAGAGRAAIAIPAGSFPLDGFTGLHDPLCVRVLLLDQGGRRLAIAVIDLTSLNPGVIDGIKATLGRIARVPAADIIVCASHSFSTPHVFTAAEAPPGTDLVRNAAMLAAIDAAVADAARQAGAASRPARIGYGTAFARIAVNRDVETKRGWWLGADDAGYSDPSVGVLRIDGDDGRPLAVLMNPSVQPSIMDGSTLASGGKLISADLAGAATAAIERHYGPGTVALFLAGSGGDQAPYLQAAPPVVGTDGTVARDDLHEAGFALVDRLGGRLAQQVIAAADAIRPEAGLQTIAIRRVSITVPTQAFSPRNPPRGPVTGTAPPPDGVASTPVVLLRLGDAALVGVQPELVAAIGRRIKADPSFPGILVATMVDGGAKYMADRAGYDRLTYEARSSGFARGAAEILAGSVARLLAEWRAQPG